MTISSCKSLGSQVAIISAVSPVLKVKKEQEEAKVLKTKTLSHMDAVLHP
jgi:hypothetical protein